MFSEASLTPAGDFLACKGDSENGDETPKEDGDRGDVARERLDDMLLVKI
jgi:hypothetical protein